MILYQRGNTALLACLQRGPLLVGVCRSKLGDHTRYLVSLPGVTVNIMVFRRQR